jgi:uncharacterized membrane protein YtjA (UPF0391 family)
MKPIPWPREAPERFVDWGVQTYSNGWRTAMLYYALIFLVIALVAGALGFTGIAGASAGIAQIIFFVFLALLVISLLAAAFRRA